ncbi:MAG TPA: hypothetical protein VIX73_34165, partial [Kofleriaceae bacterium]
QAVIISTRQVRRGLLGSAVEISAAVDAEGDDAGQMSGPTTGGPGSSSQPRNDQELEKLIAPLRSELRSLRALVRTSGDSRGTTEMRAEIAALRKLVEELARPAAPAEPHVSRRRATTQHDVRPARTTQPGDTPLTAPSTGTAVMLVGPTGAGKTTTIAKIAARAALIDGRRVALITLDNYRVGGIEQIRTFAELIGIPLEVADDPAALAEMIDPSNELTLIDTAGHIAGLALEVHLVIPAGSTPAQVDELVSRYSALGATRLLFTKLDEVDRAPELALAPTRAGVPITWVTTGQAVPEDIEQPTAARVLELASGGLASRKAACA